MCAILVDLHNLANKNTGCQLSLNFNKQQVIFIVSMSTAYFH